MPHWIDFKALRARLDFAAVLTHYGVEVNRKGDQHHGFCPLPTHQGDRRSASFSANLAKGIWQCFGCGGKGNVIDFACHMEGLDPGNGDDFRKAAVKLHERFIGPIEPPKRNPAVKKAATASAPPPPPQPPQPAGAPETVVNAPLDFELKELDPAHPYLLGRGFSAETVAHFGLGYCSRGLMKGRVAIPLHHADGRLIGYAGRIVDDGAITADNPKYKLPSKRERNGVVYEFQKSRLLYNYQRVPRPVDDLVVVEGFPAVWWLWQAGHKDTVALMGSSCSDAQATLICDLLSPHGRAWVMTDGDEAGVRCAVNVLVKLAPRRFVRWATLAQGKQPTDYAPDDLHALLKLSELTQSKEAA